MGKSGDLLRAEKGNKTEYYFTAETLKQHDMLLAHEIIKQRKRELQDFVDKRAEQVARDYYTEENMLDAEKVLLYALSLSCKSLIEEFGWSPIKHRVDDRMKIVRFTKKMEKEIAEAEKYGGLKQYAEYVQKRYGVGWISRITPDMEDLT